jgi:glyoxylase-like metal-dependent hydrolase (beta-lactamase superfamily II)
MTMTFEISRRNLLRYSAATATFLATPAFAKAPMIGTPAPAFYRFKLGDSEITIVSDGPLALGEPKPEVFPGATKDEISKVLTDNFLPIDSLSLEQNAVVVNTGDKLALFDTGIGASKMFGSTAGRLLENLKAAGINAGDIDAVILSHAHPDHCWGIMSAAAQNNFPNAQIYLAESDLRFWTDEGNAQGPMADLIKQLVAGTRQQLLPNRARIQFVKDGQNVIAGIQAMAAPGHTVGHTVYLITSAGKTLCYAGDIAHHHRLIVERPRIQFVFDTDPQQAVASRLRVFDMLANDRVAFIAYHFPWPGLGHWAKRGDGYHYEAAPLLTAF